MNTQKRKEIYKQWWLWGAMIVVGFAIYFITNINQLTKQKFNSEREIHLYTREIGSGTRAAFTDVTQIVNENDDDILSSRASVQNSTNATMQAVESDHHRISYKSLGSLNDSEKA